MTQRDCRYCRCGRTPLIELLRAQEKGLLDTLRGCRVKYVRVRRWPIIGKTFDLKRTPKEAKP